jgi:large subunit ribosomal protein L35
LIKALSSSSRRSCSHFAIRYNSTAPSSSAGTGNPSSSTTPWSPALPQGQHKAYDESLTYLHSLRDSLLSRISALKALPNPTPKQLRKIEALEVEAHVNDPSTRHIFRETRSAGLMDRPVIRHLAERKWKKEGGLDLIMGRVYQNKVVPDVIPDLAPTSPLTLQIKDGVIEPGIYLEPSKLEHPPRITWQCFQHPSLPSSLSDTPSAMYTLLTIDPDVPDSQNHTFSERIMSLKVDIPLSVVDGQVDLLSDTRGKEVFTWEPPAPPKGTDPHRYVTLLIRQSPSFIAPSITSRESFSTRDFLKNSKLLSRVSPYSEPCGRKRKTDISIGYGGK